MKYNITGIVYVVVQFVAFLLVLAGTPLEMFRSVEKDAFFNNICISLWGFKTNCSAIPYDYTVDKLFSHCPQTLDQFHAAQAFAIISILVYLAAFIAGLTLLFCCSFLRLVCLALNIVGSVTLCVVWALMVLSFYKEESPLCPSLGYGGTFASGFVLLIVSWVLDTINIILLLLPCTTTDDAQDKTEEPPTAQE
ncbi:amastin-like surface protein [Leishmania donovani]|uniref:Amastin surface glycofamily protein n=1 Tax=Leishmania donovani TaxID=5661 RepID=A0A6J8FKW1_LEIDO|nr:amastin-like surface protein [Leishmania donovani]VDZ48357.1 amastin-like_surface_protein_putative/GeneDB:LmjF.34.1560/GeneDB:LmjF.34.1580/GeneDB:LmjF.34.1600/GeneDB:LmjF.34.1620/GeneDB:LmjF.34.1640/GeneDB:LmjF.34.1660/GeneDB:LmjF.34.1680/GeneDB:LmjF.34.1700/GeneDB:LmjF.34.1720/GeneDB:LmjF.34.1740/GeneDB:LmjF.34.1760/GeneDB:LmjF.34.1780/GeneDB:LmjF.34.1800/GeneDB:LmjF.34.1820/GeneDB:LmjF.34.1860/GeneDB:LmjF.34.1880/GeneDB:LmjF.34.1900/GeneDB:LmjF.34.1920/GeneDB:LmjF.34.1940/GeneDB:LmjF.34.1960/